LNILDDISKYGWSYEYLKERQQIIKTMTVAQIKRLAEKYLDANRMIWLMVGDAKTQLPRMKDLGFGEPVLLEK
jgi:zinc protease